MKERKEERLDLERVTELNDKRVKDFSENISLSSHVIDVILFNDGVLPHHLHSEDTITVGKIPFFPNHEDLPKGTLPYKSQNLKIRGPNFGGQFHLLLGWFVVAVGSDFVEREEGIEGGREARGGTHEGVGPTLDDNGADKGWGRVVVIVGGRRRRRRRDHELAEVGGH